MNSLMTKRGLKKRGTVLIDEKIDTIHECVLEKTVFRKSLSHDGHISDSVTDIKPRKTRYETFTEARRWHCTKT